MTLAEYPGHLVVVAFAAALAAATFLAFRSAEVRAPARGRYRWLLMSLQYAAILLLFVITWDPSTLQTREIFQRNTVVTLFDTSRSMSIADGRGLARLDQAVEKFSLHFGPDDPAGPQYRLYGFDRQGYYCTSPDLLRRWGSETDLHAAFSLPARHTRREVADSAGAVIFTDGQAADRNVHNYQAPLEDGGPILLVGVGSRAPRTDIAVTSLSAPARAWIDTAYPAAVTITVANPSRDALIVELLHDGQVMESREVPVDQLKRSSDRPNAAEATLEFAVPATHLGTHVLTARAVVHRNETNTANNARSASVEVAQEQRLQVLLYSQQASFDIGKIRQALAWDRRIDLDLRLEVIRDPVQSERASAGLGYATFPATEDELREFDVIILGPCDVSRFTSDQREAIYGFVAARGGGLLFLPGPAVTSPAAWQDEQADALLPVILDDGDPRLWPPAPDTIRLSFEAQVGRIFNPTAFTTPGQSISPHYSIARAKPAATTLATVGDMPIISAHRLGLGRICLLNASKLFTLYREDREGGLLSSMICGLAAYLGAAPSGGTGVELFVERALSDPRRVAFNAYVTDDGFDPVGQANVLLSVGSRVVSMQPVGEGRYTAEIDSADSQSLVATVEAEINGIFLGERTIAANLPPVRDEMSETDLDERFLQALARQLNARYLHIDQFDEGIAQTFAARQVVGSEQKVSSAWPRWPLLLILCAILSVKWFLRRSIGLV